MIRSGNPALQAFAKSQTWDTLGGLAASPARAKAMTVQGTAIKALVLLAICATTAIVTWQQLDLSNLGKWAMPACLGSLGVGLVCSLAIYFAPKSAMVVAPIYAAVEGAFLAVISAIIGVKFTGKMDPTLVMQGATATLGVAGGLFALYSAGLVRMSGTVMKVVIAASAGVFVYGLALLIGNGLFNLGLPSLFSSTSPLGFLFTGVCVVLASLTLVMDFQMIDDGAAAGAPKHMEWVGAHGLLVSIVWLYVELLRLLAKMRADD